MSILSLIIFIVAFSGMVIIHELGHFLAARACNIEVEEFGIGLPTPGALTLFTWKGTRFTFNWLPLGGFIRPKGENDPTIPGGLAAANPWKRLIVLFAGPLMNLIMAVILFSIVIAISGGIITYTPESSGNSRVLITNVMANSPAKEAGMQMGDVLVSGAGQSIKTSDDIRNVVVDHVDKPVSFVVERQGKQIELMITPKFNEAEGRPLIGIEYCSGCAFVPITSVGANLQTSLRYTGNQIYALVTLPVKLIRGTIAPDQGRMVGLKGIYDIMNQSVTNDVQASQQAAAAPSTSSSASPYNKPVQTLLLIATLSISLGVFNLFPIPALDGGRIIFVLPELITRRRVPAQFENIVHTLGMAVLLLLMIYINVMDFINPVVLPK
ncbi:MAG: M50 family metallopeptidase [Chloroflexota bacterium]